MVELSGKGGAASIELSVPAKVNLWLEVVGKRSDGYHDLSSLMLPVGIYDRLELQLHEETGIAIECEYPGVPADSRNLAWKAARLYLDAAGSSCGAHIRLEKNIPAGAGLGGGSADAAAVLLGMNELFAGRLSGEELHGLARLLGADVPFFLYRRPSLATGIGESLETVEGLPAYPLVLIKPPVTVPTGGVYQSLKLTRGQSRIKLARFLAHPWQLREVMENDLETVTLVKYPLLTQIKDWLIERGALGALMSGSGPTVFGVFREKGHAREAEQLAKLDWKECWVAATSSES